jgi:aspartokinase-like uncharacterized kinase
VIDAVIKIGGALLSAGDALQRALAALERIPPKRSYVVVPGGGPFADVVRSIDKRHALNADDAHWMAILGMDQFAMLLASRVQNAELVYSGDDIARAHLHGRIPVLAPYRWLREADPLPHSWEVTSDSIAAWIAGELCARHLILIKVSTNGRDPVVDTYFDRARPAGVELSILTPEMLTEKWFPS